MRHVLAILALVSLSAVSTRAQCPIQKTAGSGVPGLNGLGDCVAMSADTAVVSAAWASAPAWWDGLALVFLRDDGGTPSDPLDDSWTQAAVLDPSSQPQADKFGASLAVHGDTILAGAVSSYATIFPPLCEKGLAFFFARDRKGTPDPADDTWIEQQVLEAGDGFPCDYFGAAVALEGSSALISAGTYGDLDAVYAFERHDSGTPGDPLDDTWIEFDKFTSTDVVSSDSFGFALGLSGNTAVVGAPYFYFGSAYVFERVDAGTPADPYDDTWVETAKLWPSDAVDLDFYGISADIDGDTILVGAQRQYGGPTGGGRAFVFERDERGTPLDPLDDVWIETAMLAPSAPGSYVVAYRVALQGDYALLSGGGSAYLYRREDPGTPADPFDDLWPLVEELVAPSAGGFGRDVDVFETHALIGAPFDGDAGAGAGAVVAFGLQGDDSLMGCPGELSLVAGGSHAMHLHAGDAQSGRVYFVLGTLSGTSPGLGLGSHLLPLNPDVYFHFTAAHPNTATLIHTLGFLTTGGANPEPVALDLPPGLNPALAGLTVHHAFLVLDLLTVPGSAVVSFTSNAAPLLLAP